jgi:hypothetical protein
MRKTEIYYLNGRCYFQKHSRHLDIMLFNNKVGSITKNGASYSIDLSMSKIYFSGTGGIRKTGGSVGMSFKLKRDAMDVALILVQAHLLPSVLAKENKSIRTAFNILLGLIKLKLGLK